MQFDLTGFRTVNSQNHNMVYFRILKVQLLKSTVCLPVSLWL